MRILATTCIAALALMLAGRDLAALTIVRIGGQGLPGPERANDEGVNFVQLTWEEATGGDFGSTRLITFDGGSISPVFAPKDHNLTPGIRDNGGSIRSSTATGHLLNEEQLDNLFDGDPETVYFGLTGMGDEAAPGGRFAYSMYDPGCDCWLDYKLLVFDLGAPYNVGRIHFHTRPDRALDRFIPALTVGTSTDNPRKPGEVDARDRDVRKFKLGGSRRELWTDLDHIEFDILYEDFENTGAAFDLKTGGPLQGIILFAPLDHWEIAEFEIYGGGFVPRAEYISDIIDLGRPSSVDAVSWGGEVAPGARVEISARSGADEDPNHYWRNTFLGDRRSRFDADGEELTFNTYRRLEGGEAAGISPDSENWEFWTAPADFSVEGLALTATSPHEYAQFSIDFESGNDAGSRLDYIQFEVTQPPIASRVVGEIVPLEARLGEVTEFTYKLRPVVLLEDSGFDSIQIHTPIAPAAIDAVRIASRTLGEEEYEVVPYNGRFVVVRVPFVDIQASGELIEIDFRAEVFQASTLFPGRVFDSTRPQEVRHRVEPGDADPLVGAGSLTVRAERGSGRAIERLRVSALTPNGDGINDLLQIEYDLVNLAGSVPVALEVFTLAGIPVATLDTDSGGSGRFTSSWDGRSGASERVPPGLYLLRLTVRADSGTDRAVAAVPLAF